MINISVTKQGNYPVSSKKVKDIVRKTLEDKGIVSDATIDVAIVGKAKMDELNKQYYHDEKHDHPIFTFVIKDTPLFGQIVILETTEDEVLKLAAHGCLHLVGIHHS